LLRAAGIIDETQMALADHNVTFDAQAGSAVVQKAKGTLSRSAAGRYLNAPRVQIGLLAKNKFINPVMAATAFGAVDQFAVSDLDDFLGRLFAGTDIVPTPKPNQADIPTAAARACCSSVEVLHLLLGRKLKWADRQAGIDGYMSVLVDVEELREKVRGAVHGGLTGVALQKRLTTNSKVVRALINGGHLKTFTTINPINKCRTVVVAEAEAAKFEQQYVSLFVLAKERGKHFLEVKKELEADGIAPALDPVKIGASFYRRARLRRKASDLNLTAKPGDESILKPRGGIRKIV